MLPEEGQLLRIFIGENDKHEGMPLIDGAITEGLATLEDVHIRIYRGSTS